MTGTVVLRGRRSVSRLAGALRDLAIGGVLCLSPLTSLIALGWLTRMMAAQARKTRGQEIGPVGWILGPAGAGWMVRLLGGFGANIRAGMMTLAGLGVLTLPFTALWLGSWWAGWENSFNKGYEQAAIGPLVWLGATSIAVLVLAHLPFALANAAVENRLGGFFALRRIRAVRAAAGWRAAWLSLLSVILMAPVLVARAAPMMLSAVLPDQAGGGSPGPEGWEGTITLLAAFYSFAALYLLRRHAAAIHARAAKAAPPPRWRAAFWLGVSAAIWLGLVAQMLIAQFLNYAPPLWLTHPAFLLPWPG